MTAKTAAQRERAALVATLREVGPDAPTLCGDWTTRDLAAHLVIREARPDAAPGILIPALAGYTERVQDKTARENDWDVLLDKIAAGPPLLSPFKLLDPLINVGEMFIHHEDVRRATAPWEPRRIDDGVLGGIRRTLPVMAKVTMAKSKATASLRDPDGKQLAKAGDGDVVVVTGEPGELLLFVAGRDEARVEFDGHAAAIDAVRDGRGGL